MASSQSPRADPLSLHGSLRRNERLERSQARLGVDTSVPGELQDQALEERDQQARHRVGIERSWEFALRLCALYHSHEDRLWDFNALFYRNREPPIVKALRPNLYRETAPCPLVRGTQYGNEIRRELVHRLRKALFFQCPLQQGSFSAMALLDNSDNDVLLAGKMAIDRAGAQP